MKYNIESIFGDEIASQNKEMIDIIKNSNMTPEQIARILKNTSKIEKARLLVYALSIGAEDIGDKIEKAINIIRERKIEAFKKAVAEGREREFLSTMNWEEKITLEVEMKISRLGIPGEKPLSEENQRYLDIIEQSIKEDIEQEVLSQGFSSVEEWQEHNEKAFENFEDVEEFEEEEEFGEFGEHSRRR